MITQRNLTFERLNEFYGRIKKNTLKGSSLAFAGGAVRDIFCNRPVKDFDIFIQTPTSWDDDSCTAGEEIEETITALNRLFYSTATEKGSVSVAEASEITGYGGSDIINVWGWDHAFNDMPLDLVFINKDIEEHVTQSFDFGLCQAWVGYAGLRTSQAFKRDYANKTITFTGSTGGNVDDHARRIAAKYPGWKFRNYALKSL